MGNRNSFKLVLERLLEAEKLLNIGIERGSLSSIERDILLEKLRASYEQLLFDKVTDESKKVEITPKVEQIKVEPVQEISKPQTQVEIPQVAPHKPQPKAPVMEQETRESAYEEVKMEAKQVEIHETTEIISKEKEDLELDITSRKSKSDSISAKVEVRVTDIDKASTSTLAEKYQGKKKFRNETLGNGKKDVASILQNKPIGDLTKAIGINDKFLFTKELFNGNAELYARSIRQLNEFTDINDALIYIQENFNWDGKNEAANQLIDLVRRKLLIG
jgi:hypothetical protein